MTVSGAVMSAVIAADSLPEVTAMPHIQQLKKEKPAVTLSADELVALDASILSERTEPVHTLDEAFEIARKTRQQWMKAKTPVNA